MHDVSKPLLTTAIHLRESLTMTDLRTFDPNSVGQKTENIFGLPFTADEAAIAVIPVPWEVTVSYREGTASGPEAILAASYQVDLYDPDYVDAWRIGLAMEEIPTELRNLNDEMRPTAEEYIGMLEEGHTPEDHPLMKQMLEKINASCEKMNEWVQERAAAQLDRGAIAAVLGGDHSTPLGLIRELAKRHDSFGILHIDAHADLRDAYEGFTYSHASIMFNAIKEPTLTKLVQVGIRDYCEMESDLVASSDGRIVSFYDRDIKTKMFEGMSWMHICQEIVSQLPDEVYVSFDIDGLDPKLCPNTGTPVPGGLEYEQALYLVRMVAESGRVIIGFDVNEVAPGDEDEWDANVGARLLYRLANLTAKSNDQF